MSRDMNGLKRVLAFLILVPLLVLLTGCGPGAEQVMKDARQADKDVSTARFETVVTTRLPRAPISEGKLEKRKYRDESEGDVDYRSGDFQVKKTVFGAAVTARQVDDKQYWQIGGNWYEVPQAVQLPPPVTQSLSISQYIKYFKSLERLGDTKIDGEACYHIRGVPNMKEMVRQPGVTDLLKDAAGEQVRSVDELENIKGVFDFFIQKKNKFTKRMQAVVSYPASNDLIKLGYAEPGDRVDGEIRVTFSNFNKKLDLRVPPNVKPWPGQTPQG